jgi:hypothetical protein
LLAPGYDRVKTRPCRRFDPVKIVAATLVAFLLGNAFLSTGAEAGCWWNGYNHCRYWHYGWYHYGWHHGYWHR